MGISHVWGTVGVETGWRVPDWATATKHETIAGLEVVAPVTDPVTKVTKITVDATKVGVLTYVVAVKDPAGAVFGPWPWTSPYPVLKIPTATAPTLGSGVAVVVGVIGGDDVAVDPWAAGGQDFSDMAGSSPITVSYNIPPDTNPAVPGGEVAAFELSSTPSTTITKGTFVRFGRVALLEDEEGGSGGSEQVFSNFNTAKAPGLLLQFRLTGGSVETAMEIDLTASYLAHYCQTGLGA